MVFSLFSVFFQCLSILFHLFKWSFIAPRLVVAAQRCIRLTGIEARREGLQDPDVQLRLDLPRIPIEIYVII